MSLLGSLLGACEGSLRQPVHETPAFRVMRRFNRHGLIADDGGRVCMIEDWADPDGRLFRLEYQSTPDGRRAVALCRRHPWQGSVPHLLGQLICVGPGAHSEDPRNSRYSLDFVIARARYWCTAVSYYKEHGHFPD